MSSPAVALPPPPRGDFLRWMHEHPDEFSAYLQFAYAMSRFEIVVVVNGVARRCPLVFGGENATVTVDMD